MGRQPFTARLIDTDTNGPVPWLASEYISGPPLPQRVSAAEPLPTLPLVALTAALAEGLGDVQAAGLVHRGPDPSNVILSNDRPRIIDFGLATQESASLAEFTHELGGICRNGGWSLRGPWNG